MNARNLDLELLERTAARAVYLNIDGISHRELGQVLARLEPGPASFRRWLVWPGASTPRLP